MNKHIREKDPYQEMHANRNLLKPLNTTYYSFVYYVDENRFLTLFSTKYTVSCH